MFFLQVQAAQLLAQMLKTQVDIVKVVAIITFSSNINDLYDWEKCTRLYTLYKASFAFP